MARGDQSPEIKLPSQELIRHAQGDPEVVAEALVKALIEQGKAYEQMGLSVRRLSIEEHQKKLTGVTSHSPYIGQFAYDDSVPRGTTTHLTIWVTNPDSFKQWWVVGYLFFGPGNILADVGQVLLAVDARFPRFGQIGDLDAGTTSTRQYAIPIPGAVDRGLQVINLFLSKLWNFDTGQYFDRIAYGVNLT